MNDPRVPEAEPNSRGPAPPARKGGSVIAAIAVAALAKAKWLLVALKGLSAGKLLLTFGSMFAMIWFEAMRYGWAYGVGFVLLIFIHEMGHGFAIKKLGLAAGYPVFIPFVGAYISLQGQIRSPRDEANIALAGPMAGAAASAACAGIYLLTQGRLFLALAYGGFFLNMFNMIPMPPLDGGRAAAVFSKKAWWLGLAIFAGLFLLTHNPVLLVIGVLAAMNGFRSGTHHMEAPPEVRREVAAEYFGLLGFLAVGAHLTHQVLSR